MFFKSTRYEYFNNCDILGLDIRDNFDLDAVLDAADAKIKEDESNELAVNLAASYFVKNMKSIIKWRNTDKFEKDYKSYLAGIEGTERFFGLGSATNTVDKPHDFLDGD